MGRNQEEAGRPIPWLSHHCDGSLLFPSATVACPGALELASSHGGKAFRRGPVAGEREAPSAVLISTGTGAAVGTIELHPQVQQQ